MALETGTYIDALNVNNPASTDGLGQADDHMRLIKSTIKSTFPSITGAVTSTHGELSLMDGGTSRVAATLVDGDGIVVNDGGTMKQVLASSLKTYMSIPTSLTDLGISDGSSGQFLKTNGSGSFSFANPADVDNYVNSLSWNTGNGVLTVGRTGTLANLTVDLDGRYLTAHPNISGATSENNGGSTYIQDITVDGNGHVTSMTATDVFAGSQTWAATGSGSATSSGGGNFTVSTNTANKRFIIHPNVLGSRVPNISPMFGTTDSSGNFSAQITVDGNNTTFSFQWATF